MGAVSVQQYTTRPNFSHNSLATLAYLQYKSSHHSHQPSSAPASNLGSTTRIRGRRAHRRAAGRRPIATTIRTIGHHSTITRTSATTNHHEVRARNPCRILSVNNHTLIAKESRATGISAQERISILRHECRCRNIAMLAREVANLAGGGCADVAWVVLAAVGRVEVAHGGAAVAVGGDGEGVDVVDEGSVRGFGGEAGEVHGDVDAAAARSGGDHDAPCDGGA